jgi:hypothetical protein
MKQNSIHCSLVALVLGAAPVSTLPLAAQNGEELRVAAGFGYRTDANIDHDGDFSEARFNLTAERPVNLNDQWRLSPILGYRFSAFDFSGAEPWDDVHQLRGTVTARYALDEQWAIFGGPSIALAMESGADASDALTFGFTAGVTYKVNERLVVGGGLGVTTEIEDSATVRPVVIINWRIDDHWSLESGYFDAAGSGGPGAEIRYHINEQWSVAGGGQYQENRFRLDEDGSVPDGVGEDTFIPIYAKATWTINKNAALEALAGVSFGGELRLDNSRGHKIFDEDYDPAPLFGLRGIFTF